MSNDAVTSGRLEFIPLGDGPTTFDVNVWHRRQPNLHALHVTGETWRVAWLRCADGFTMSVQASSTHYCSPQQTKGWPYESFEVGYPSMRDPLLKPYESVSVHQAESEAYEMVEDVYGWVPADVINRIVINHGGLARHEEETTEANSQEPRGA